MQLLSEHMQEWNVKNCFVKLIKTLKINKKHAIMI